MLKRKVTDFFPLLSSECKNGLFEPLNYLPEDAWQNRNRHPWSEEEIDELCSEEDRMFVKNIQLSDRDILLLNFDRNTLPTKFVNPDKYPNATIYLGKIIQMGREAFSPVFFRSGSTGTYNDWVSFNPIDGRPKRSKNSTFTIIKDSHLSGLVRDPYEFNYY